jgi:hypothetical protein
LGYGKAAAMRDPQKEILKPLANNHMGTESSKCYESDLGNKFSNLETMHNTTI